MDDETPDQVYHVVFNATFPHMTNTTKIFSFELIDSRKVGNDE